MGNYIQPPPPNRSPNLRKLLWQYFCNMRSVGIRSWARTVSDTAAIQRAWAQLESTGCTCSYVRAYAHDSCTYARCVRTLRDARAYAKCAYACVRTVHTFVCTCICTVPSYFFCSSSKEKIKGYVP